MKYKFFIITLLIIWLNIIINAQNLNNCTTTFANLTPDLNSGYGMLAAYNVNLTFSNNCWCTNGNSCQKLRVNIPQNYTCEGLIISTKEGTWYEDLIDVYYLNNCQYQGLDYNISSGQKSNYFLNINGVSGSTMTGGYAEYLICKGADFPFNQNSININIIGSDLCNSIPIVSPPISPSCSTCCLNYEKGFTITDMIYHPSNKLVSKTIMSRYNDVCIKNGNQYYAVSIKNSDGNYDVQVFKNANSNPIITIGGNKDEDVSEIQVDDSGNIYISGLYKSGLISLANGYSLTNPRPGFDNGFVIKYNSSGQVQWAFGFGDGWGSTVEDLYIIDQSRFVITGLTYRSVDFDPRPNNSVLSCNGEIAKGYVAMYTENPTSLPSCNWVKTLTLDNGYGPNKLGEGAVVGLGVTALGSRIFFSGDYFGRNVGSGTAKLMFRFVNSSNSDYFTNLTVDPKVRKGYVGELDLLGNLKWIKPHMQNPGTSLYINDLEVFGNVLYGVGMYGVASYNIGTSSGSFQYLNEKEIKNYDIEELSISNDGSKIYTIGGFGNVAQILVFDKNWNDCYKITPGEFAYSKGFSISCENQKVGIAVGTSLNKLHPNSPNNKSNPVPIQNSPFSFFGALYGCCQSSGIQK
ncbi:MAG: hypothetical protein H6567_02635 [Lewinellaceae bacterium]|nr:hypothetical protein [Lewinellaceae bacterium]